MKTIVKKYQNSPVQIKASFWFLICAFFQKGISFITTPIFTRLLSTTEYGQYNIFTSWSGILTVIVTLNLYYGVYTSGLVKFDERKDEYSSSLQGLTITLVFIWTIVYLSFKDFWNGLFSLNTIQMLMMLLMMWTTAAFSFWAVEQRNDFKYKKLVLITIAVSVLKPIVSIALINMMEDRVTARIMGLAAIEFVFYIWLFIAQMQRGKRFFSLQFWKYALSFNIPLVPHYLSQTILNSADRIMIGQMVSDSAAGIYSLAYSISMIMTLFNTAMMQTIEPWLYKKIKQKQIQNISKVAYPSFIIIAAVNIALIAFAPEVVSIFAPTEYAAAIYVIPPAAMSVFFLFSYNFFAVFEFYYGKSKQIAFATTIGAILNILLNYIFIHMFGYVAAGYTTLICFIVYALFHYLFMIKLCQKELDGARPYDTKIYMGIACVFMLFGFAFLFSYRWPIVRYGLILMIAVVLVVLRKKIIISINELLSFKKVSTE